MDKIKFLFSKSLLHYFWEEFLVRYRFKFVLPKTREAVLDGIRLDLSTLSLKIRNRILMGLYEMHEKRMCEEFLTANDSVMEIGGAIGFIGLVCQKKIGIRNFYTFEANPATLAVLRKNFELNGLKPASWNLALGPGEGTLELDVTTDFWENSVLPSTNSQPGNMVKVPSASLAGLLARIGRPVNVLIIDVEGAEQFIDFAEVPPQVEKIIVELHPKLLGPERTYDLIANFIRNGFHVAREEADTFVFLRNERVGLTRPVPSWEQKSAPQQLAVPAGA